MLKSLQEFPSKTFNETSLRTDHMSLLEMFIRLYIEEVQKLIKKGLKSSYYAMEDNLNVYKGKMVFSQQLKYNLVHRQRFYTRYDEFGMNRAENRLIKATLLYLLKQSTSNDNINEIRKQLIHFEPIEQSKNYNKDFSQVKIDRNLKDYETIMQWSKIF